MLPVLIAIGVGVALGIVTAIVLWRANSRINTVQRQLNRIENKLSAAGAVWLAELLEDAIVGDTKALELRAKSFVESEDITDFFLQNISFPLTLYTIKETAQYYPELFDRIVSEVNLHKTVKKGAKSANN